MSAANTPRLRHLIRNGPLRPCRIDPALMANGYPWAIKIVRELAAREGVTCLVRREFAGSWSRRIDDEHRLIYRVTATRVYFLSARDHY
ncbi:MAG: type II toxin-antitoxin system YoeB family toxin [Gemmatimonadales bacterium]|nr:type II toxin-antitoxin system YoeB family toxin [Gemmatimonadales bacterium]MYG49197.1 type II toxin-antitoxin system YoeB family toxin [Gemmatimonadales bacterium]MYK01961.1 type II toxin-antitoxin system YoeB family toxin [Candidatus Palauibacter ramosifaciens]